VPSIRQRAFRLLSLPKLWADTDWAVMLAGVTLPFAFLFCRCLYLCDQVRCQHHYVLGGDQVCHVPQCVSGATAFRHCFHLQERRIGSPLRKEQGIGADDAGLMRALMRKGSAPPGAVSPDTALTPTMPALQLCFPPCTPV
jgi:hypothetical protein